MVFALHAEIFLFCTAILFFLGVRLQSSGFLHEQQFYLLYYIWSCIFCFLFNLCWVKTSLSPQQYSATGCWTVCILYYVALNFTALTWFFYTENIRRSDLFHCRWKLTAALLPAGALLLLILTAPVNGWLFFIGVDNVYRRGPLFWIQLLVYNGYFLYTALKSLWRSRHTHLYSVKIGNRALAACVVPVVALGLVQNFTQLPVACLGTTLAVLYVFIVLQEQLISLDALTRLNNRNQLNRYLSTRLSRPDAERPLYLLMMDVDDFKQINDHYGHVEGDHALQLVADALRISCGKKDYFLARYGGDEFVVLCELGPGQTPETLAAGIQAELDKADVPYPLRLSIGWTQHTPGITSAQEFLARTDVRLYQVKQEHKTARSAAKRN